MLTIFRRARLRHGLGLVGLCLVATSVPSGATTSEAAQVGKANLVSDIFPGADGSVPRPIAQIGDTLYFTADDGETGRELWASEGTQDSTRPIKDINPGPEDSVIGGPRRRRLVAQIGDTLYFAADDGSTGMELWKSEGTRASTRPLKVINPGAEGSLDVKYRKRLFAAIGDTLIFSAHDGSTGTELWMSEGTTSSTRLLKDVIVGPDSSLPKIVTKVGDTLYFTVEDPSTGRELWKTNGTKSSTKLVKDIVEGREGASIKFIAKSGDTLYFTIYEDTSELWRTNGTRSSTDRVDGGIRVDGPDSYLTTIGDTLYFDAYQNGRWYDDELWAVNDTTSSARLVKNINPEEYGSSYPSYVGTIGETLYFGASRDGKWRLWRSRGTADSTWRVKGGMRPGEHLFTIGDTFYFGGYRFSTGSGLWKSKGTAESTRLVKELRPRRNPSSLSTIARIGDTFYVIARRNGSLRSLWRSEGTAASTQPIENFTPREYLGRAGDTMYFGADDGSTGYELWSVAGASP